MANGSFGATQGAAMAAKTTMRKMIALSEPALLRNSRPRNAPLGRLGTGVPVATPGKPEAKSVWFGGAAMDNLFPKSDARIDPDIDEVDDEIDRREDQREHDHARLDHEEVHGSDRRDDLPPDPRPPKDR